MFASDSDRYLIVNSDEVNTDMTSDVTNIKITKNKTYLYKALIHKRATHTL